MALNKVEICGVNTAKLPSLSNEQRAKLFQRIKEGDTVEGVVKNVTDFGAFIDLGGADGLLHISEMSWGRVENPKKVFGLMKAIDNFNTELDVKFSTYAVPMIIGEIRRFLRDNNSIRVSRSLKDTAYKAIYAKESLTKKNLKEPTIMEIAEEIGVSKEDIVYALDAIQNPMSLYEPVYTDGGDTLYVMDQVSDKKNKEETWVEHLSLREAMKRLNERENEIITLRFFEGKTQMEVAEIIGISQAQVSRLEKNALKVMRNYLAG